MNRAALRAEYRRSKGTGFEMACLKSIYYRHAEELRDMSVDERRRFCHYLGLKHHANPTIGVSQVIKVWEYNHQFKKEASQ